MKCQRSQKSEFGSSGVSQTCSLQDEAVPEPRGAGPDAVIAGRAVCGWGDWGP